MRVYFLVLSASFFAGNVSAAEIKSTPAKDNRVLVTITGELTPGDADIFKSSIKAANDSGKLVSNVRLNSIGGNLLEGVNIADAVRFGKISTNVGKGRLARPPASWCMQPEQQSLQTIQRKSAFTVLRIRKEMK